MDRFNLQTKKTKRQVDKAALLASKKFLKSTKTLVFANGRR